MNYLEEIYCGYYVGNLLTRSWRDRQIKFGTRDPFTIQLIMKKETPPKTHMKDAWKGDKEIEK